MRCHTDLHQLAAVKWLVQLQSSRNTSRDQPGRECGQGERISVSHCCKLRYRRCCENAIAVLWRNSTDDADAVQPAHSTSRRRRTCASSLGSWSGGGVEVLPVPWLRVGLRCLDTPNGAGSFPTCGFANERTRWPLSQLQAFINCARTWLF